MTGQELWASLLQEAIQGRLVAQRDDEPAVEQIGDAPEDVPFAIPEKWKWSKLGDVLLGIQAGKSYKCDEVPPADDQCGLVKVSAVTWGEFDENESKTCFSNENWVDAYAIHKGDFLISRANTAELVGSCVVVNRIHKRLMLSDKILRLKFSDRVYQSYVLYLLRSPFIRSQFVENATGTSNSMKNISQTVIRALTIPLPPLAEQRRIVARLEELRPLVDDYGTAETELTRMEAELPDKLRASLLQEAIQGRLVEQRDDEPAVEQMGDAPEDVPFAIPEKWKWVRLHDVGKIVSGGTPKTSVKEYWHDGVIPWITPADLGKNRQNQHIAHGEKYITQKGLENSSAQTMPEGSVVFSSRAPIGYVAIAKNSLCTNQGCKSVVPNENYVMSEWLYYSLICRTQDIQARASGTTFLEISSRKFGETWFPLPPLAEQRRIVARLEELLPEVARLAG